MLPVSGNITSYYGSRIDPFTGQSKFHSGVDIGAKTGTNISNMLTGQVITKEYSKSYGNTVVIKSENGLTQRYAHLSSFGNFSIGDILSVGSSVGKVGSTGRSTGSHLHYEILKDGKTVNPLSLLNNVTTLNTSSLINSVSESDDFATKFYTQSTKVSIYIVIGILMIISLFMVFSPVSISDIKKASKLIA